MQNDIQDDIIPDAKWS